jgi:hypothetical protein
MPRVRIALAMATTKQVYEDRWGEIFDRPDIDLIELRWFDTTGEMTAQDFQAWLSTFADHVESSGRHRALVDGTSFLMDPANMNAPWRDEHIIPRYNAAEIVKFGVHMPEGMPAIGAPPAPEPWYLSDRLLRAPQRRTRLAHELSACVPFRASSGTSPHS